MQLVLLAPVVGAAATAEVNFGPQNCVSLSKTEQGTCMVKTNCDNIDTSGFDFTFVCLSRQGEKETQVKHEYGKGGFDADEDYDTGVACDECLAEPRPTGTPGALDDAHAQLQQYSSGAAPAAQTPPPKAAAFYGPGGCIAAYRSSQGTCIVQTRCTSQGSQGLMKEYNYGLTCVDSQGESTRHLFGKNSFDAEETFDTLVECQLCLGFDGAGEPAGNATDTSLAADVATLKTEVQELQKAVGDIKTQLGIGNATAADAAAPAEAEADEPQPAQFLHKFRHHYSEKHTRTARRVRHPKRHRDEDLDEDFDDEDLDDGDEDADDDLDY